MADGGTPGVLESTVILFLIELNQPEQEYCISYSLFHFSLPRDSINKISNKIPRIVSRPIFLLFFYTAYLEFPDS